VPNDHPALEAVEDVTGQGQKKLFHALIIVSGGEGSVRNGNNSGCRASDRQGGAGCVHRFPTLLLDFPLIPSTLRPL
jgi:hypothetical protein